MQFRQSSGGRTRPALQALLALSLLIALGAALGFVCARLLQPQPRLATADAAELPLRALPSAVELGRVGPTDCGQVVAILNRSALPVFVRRIVPSCWCVSGTCHPRHIAPGGRAKLTVVFHGASFHGEAGDIEKALTLGYTQAGSARAMSLVVPIRGELAPSAPVLAYPNPVSFPPLAAGGSASAEVYFRAGAIRRLPPIPVAIRVVLGAAAAAKPSKNVSTGRKNASTAVRLRVPTGFRPGPFVKWITIDGGTTAPIRICLKGDVVSRTGRSRQMAVTRTRAGEGAAAP